MEKNHSVNFQFLFESAPGLYLALLPDLTIAAVSDSYLSATLRQRDQVVGRGLFEVFPDNPEDPTANGVSNLHASINLVLKRKAPHAMAIQRYDIPKNDGTFEERFWSPLNLPVLGPEGEVLYVLHKVEDVTAQIESRKKGEAVTREAQLLLHSSIESLRDILIFSIDRNYRILHHNTGFREATFKSYGKYIDVGDNLLMCITSEEDRSKAKMNFDRAMAGESHMTIEEYGILDRSFFETRYNPLVNHELEITGCTVLTTNITQRRKSEIELKRLASIVDGSMDAIIGKSLDGIITNWNQGATRLFGYSPEEVIGRSDDMLIADDIGGFESTMTERLLSGVSTDQFETKRRRKDGSLIDVSLRISPIKAEDGSIVGLSKIARDISATKAAEERIKQINLSLEEAKQAAEVANRTKSQFLANMSHEIRTPLNAVIGLSHLLAKTELSPKQLDYLRKIQSSSESLLGIINDILDFSKVESGRLTLEEVNFDLEEIFQKLGNVITYKANAKGLEIAFGIESRVPTHLIGDRARLEQILINLCSNAVKFTDEGEVVVSVKCVSDEVDSVGLSFEVRDTGIGMDRVQVSKLFQPFTQADDTISRKYGGTGLGLSIIKRLVEMMQGSVNVESEPGQGSRFSFSVRLKKQKHQRKMPSLAVDPRKLGVLLVDDNLAARGILEEALGSLKFRVTTVTSGIQAIHFLKNNYHHNPVKLVLMDWKMPEMDGLEAARIIRQDAQFDDVKIMMMCTSYANEELYQVIDEVGLSGIFIKPIRYSHLYDSIMAVIENGRAEKVVEPTKPTGEKLLHGRLLLVEDNEINQLVAVELLKGFGFTVDIACNGLEAVEKIKESGKLEEFYDVVLMDLQMPVMGGRAATVEIRKLSEFKSLPIIAMTADAMLNVRDECIVAGMNDFISKPIDPNALLETLERWLDKGEVPDGSNKKLRRSNPNEEPLDGIDLKAGLSNMGGNKKLYTDVLLKFAENHEHFLNEMETKFRAGDFGHANRMIHTLKGLSGSLGMKELHEQCKELEKGMKEGIGDNIAIHTGGVAKELIRVRELINRLVLKRTNAVNDLLPHKLNPKFDKLERALHDRNPEALNELKNIGTIQGFEPQFERLNKAMSGYDFERATKLLSELRTKINEQIVPPR